MPAQLPFKLSYPVLFAGIVFLTVVGIIVALVTKNLPVGQEDSARTLPKVNKSSKFVLEGELPELPKNAKIYTVSPITFGQAEAENVAAAFGITQPPQKKPSGSETSYLFTSDESFVTVYDKPPQVQYQKRSEKIARERLAQEAYRQIAVGFIKSKGLFEPKTEFSSPSMMFVTLNDKGQFEETTTFTKARYVKVLFSTLLDGIAFNLEEDTQSQVECWVTLDGVVQKAFVTMPSVKLTAEKTVDLMSLETAFERLELGDGKLEKMEGVNLFTLEAQEVITAKFSQLEMIYLLSEAKNELKPYYRLQGSAFGAGNSQFKLQATIPAY